MNVDLPRLLYYFIYHAHEGLSWNIKLFWSFVYEFILIIRIFELSLPIYLLILPVIVHILGNIAMYMISKLFSKNTQYASYSRQTTLVYFVYPAQTLYIEEIFIYGCCILILNCVCRVWRLFYVIKADCM